MFSSGGQLIFIHVGRQNFFNWAFLNEILFSGWSNQVSKIVLMAGEFLRCAARNETTSTSTVMYK